MTLDQRIRCDIEARIHSGDWPPGTRIPFEHELVTHYGCSRATVSKALQRLAHDGLIERRRKAGSFVARPHIESAVLEVPDLAEAVRARGEVHRWELRMRRRGDERRGAESGIVGPVLHLAGVHHSGDLPLAWEQRTLSLSAVPQAEHESFEEIAPGSWLLAHVPWTEARHRIQAVEASPEESGLLGIRSHAACLQLERWTWRASEPVTYVRQLFPGSRYDLVAEFRP
ncbi:histidine utilization repressor [Sphingomonas cannabina]|uniref:histidine utilization repressor n=1 Tax=Sphingomonas cannabina TaxID=2899123 RepID=UPI001F2F11AC|nr:histidine utilization repressor [Sphingomonas cannabina]UIJ44346.1 histidine utilization repressor [Sphingomonas cannabina]